MTVARRDIVSIEDTPYYHVIGRCVRRAFLCGRDVHTGTDYEHRRAWVVDRLETLAKVFAIEVSAYAIMHNHYHLVVRLAPDRLKEWDDEEVMRRWKQIYGIPLPIQIGCQPGAAEIQQQTSERDDRDQATATGPHVSILDSPLAISSRLGSFICHKQQE